MKNLGILLLCVFLLTSFKPVPHEFHMSVTEIEYKDEKKSLQIITRVFTDDFENVLRERYSDDIRLSHEKEAGDPEKYIEKYLSQKLKISTGNQPLQLKYLGKEYDADQIVMYIEIEEVEAFRQISVENAILTDMFDDQKNVVHVKRNKKNKSLLLDADKDRGVIQFD